MAVKTRNHIIVLCIVICALSGFGRAQNSTPADAAFAEAEKALTVRLLDNSIAQADADMELLSQLKASAKALSERLVALQTNDEGKRLASALDVISAEQVRQLIDVPGVSSEMLAMKEKELTALQSKLKAFRTDPPAGYVAPDQQQDELVEISTSLRQRLATVRERDGWLTSLITSASKSLDTAKAPSLTMVLADSRARQQQALNAAQHLGIDLATPIGLSTITESARIAELERSQQQANALLEERRNEIELAKIDLDMKLRLLREEKDRELALVNKKLADSEARRDVVNASADATREQGHADAEKIRLVQKCHDPEVQRLLAPFLTSGYWQPGDVVGKPFLHDRGPMSFSLLSDHGVLNGGEAGLTKLYIAGNATYINWPGQQHPDTDRAKWGYPRVPSKLTQEDWRELQHTQDLLRELGPTLVEQKMLAP